MLHVMLAMMIPILTVVLLMVTVISWLTEQKLVKPQHLALRKGSGIVASRGFLHVEVHLHGDPALHCGAQRFEQGLPMIERVARE